MILMRMGEHDAGEVFALLHQIADVGQDQIDAGQMLFRGKRHAEIDRQPLCACARRRAHRSTGSCRSRRRRRAARIPVPACGCAMIRRPPKPKTSPAVMVVDAAGLLQQQAAGVIEPLKRPAEFALRQPHPDVLAEAGGALEPVGADRRQSPRRARHCVSRRCMAAASAAKSASGVTSAPAAARSVAG